MACQFKHSQNRNTMERKKKLGVSCFAPSRKSIEAKNTYHGTLHMCSVCVCQHILTNSRLFICLFLFFDLFFFLYCCVMETLILFRCWLFTLPDRRSLCCAGEEITQAPSVACTRVYLFGKHSHCQHALLNVQEISAHAPLQIGHLLCVFFFCMLLVCYEVSYVEYCVM